MKSVQIEMTSINALKDRLVITDYLLPHINDNDKEPSWDGDVYIQQNKNYTKGELRKVPIQVKGRHEADHSKNEISYPPDIDDLKNYYQNGGIIYFVIYMRKAFDGQSYEKQIYYAQLEPLKLKEILRATSKKQQTKNIRLKLLPKDNSDIVNLFINFFRNQKKQISFLNNDIYTIDEITDKYKQVSLGFTISGIGLNKSNFQSHVDSNNVYLYAHSPDFPIPIPLMMQLEKLTSIKEIDRSISINDKIFYNKLTREQNKGLSIIKFGKSFTITINPEKETFNFNFEPQGHVRILAKDLT